MKETKVERTKVTQPTDSIHGSQDSSEAYEIKPNSLYTILKIPINVIISQQRNVKLSKEDEKQYYIDLSDSPLFDQIRRISKAKGIHIDTKVFRQIVFLYAPRNPKTEEQLKLIIADGFHYNGKKYVRFGKSSAQSKEGITAFVTEDIYPELFEASQMGISVDKCVISKYEAQRCLIFSSCTLIPDYIPNIVIIDEYTKTIPNQLIKYISEKYTEIKDKDTGEIKQIPIREVEQGVRDIDISPFDGCGCHSLEFSQKVQQALKLDYTPYGCQIRMPFVKGYSVYVPFKEILKEWNITQITDVYGKVHNVEDIDAIWNTTMFKAHKLFKSKFGSFAWHGYIEAFKKYGYKLGISKYSHHISALNLKARLNFQYIQALDLWDKDYVDRMLSNKGNDDEPSYTYDMNSPAISLASYTTDLFEKIIKGDKFYTLKFMGINDTVATDVRSKYMEAVLVNDIMLKDPAIKRYVYNKLTKYIQEAKVGKVYADGFYHTLVGDMIGYLQFAVGKEVKGCLGYKEFYCGRRQGKALSFRSPLICPSEVNDINIVTNDVINKWFAHFKDQDIVMVNMYDISLPQQGGAD